MEGGAGLFQSRVWRFKGTVTEAYSAPNHSKSRVSHHDFAIQSGS